MPPSTDTRRRYSQVPSTRRSARAPIPRMVTCHGPYVTCVRPPSARTATSPLSWTSMLPSGTSTGELNGPDSHSLRSTEPTHSLFVNSLVQLSPDASYRVQVRPSRRWPRGTGNPAKCVQSRQPSSEFCEFCEFSASCEFCPAPPPPPGPPPGAGPTPYAPAPPGPPGAPATRLPTGPVALRTLSHSTVPSPHGSLRGNSTRPERTIFAK